MKKTLNLSDKQNLLVLRANILRHIRYFLEMRGYIEVETPQRVRTPGTDVHLDAFESENRYLITSPEFHMKRLLASGFDRIYQTCHCFRKGERSPLHNPEFSMLEFYAAELDMEDMMREVEEIIWDVAVKMKMREVIYDGSTCSLEPPWRRRTVEDAFREHAGWSPMQDFNEDRFYYDLVDKVEKHLGVYQPTLLYHYPPQLAMLAKITEDEPPVARRFEVYISNVEIANAFEELSDSDEQRRRFENDLIIRQNLSKPLYPSDNVFLSSLTDLPPCCGIAIGLDRLTMLLTGSENIDQVIAFPEEEV